MKVSKIFLTDSDFESIFGKDVTRIVRTIGHFSGDKCSTCGGRCCREIGCGFFSEKFGFCPIYEIRPRECRYHFCHEILNSVPMDEKDREVLNKPIKDLLSNQRVGITELFPLFPNFMIDVEGLTLLCIKEEVNSIMEAFNKGEIEKKQATMLLKAICLSTGK
jgi:hypothetical protein